MVSAFRSILCAAALAAALGGCATGPRPITKLVGGRQIVTRSIDPDAYEHVSRALIYEEQERWQDAAAEIERALVFDGDAPELHAYLAELWLRLGKLKKAADAAQTSVKLGPTASGYLAEAHVRRAARDLPGMVTALRRAKDEVDFGDNSDDAEEVFLELADAELQILDLPSATSTLETLCSAAPSSGSCHLRLTAIYWALGQMSKAKAELDTALAVEPNQLEALVALAWIHASMGEDDDARKVFREALDRSENALEIAAAFARFLVGIGSTKEAEQLADDLADNSLDEETVALRVELERSARRFDRALALLARSRQMGIEDTQKTRLSLLQAGLLKDQGKMDEAVAVLMKVGKDSPVYLESRLRAAELLRDTNKATQAMKLVEEAVANAQGDKEAIELDGAISLALIEEKRGDAKAAIARLQAALSRAPEESRLSMTLAAVKERSGEWKQALTIAEGLLAKGPGSVEVLNFWGFVASDHNDALDLAHKRLQVANALDPGSGGLIDSLGWSSFRRNDLAHAVLFLEQASRLEPADPEIQWHLGVVYVERKDKDRATKAFRRALGSNPDDRLRRKVEESLARLGGKASQ